MPQDSSRRSPIRAFPKGAQRAGAARANPPHPYNILPKSPLDVVSLSTSTLLTTENPRCLKPWPHRGPPTLLFANNPIPPHLHELNHPPPHSPPPSGPGPAAFQSFRPPPSRPTQSRFVLSLTCINLSPRGDSPPRGNDHVNLQHTAHSLFGPLLRNIRRFLLAPPTSFHRRLIVPTVPRKMDAASLLKLPLRQKDKFNFFSILFGRRNLHSLNNSQHRPSSSPSASRGNIKKPSARPVVWHWELPAAGGESYASEISKSTRPKQNRRASRPTKAQSGGPRLVCSKVVCWPDGDSSGALSRYSFLKSFAKYLYISMPLQRTTWRALYCNTRTVGVKGSGLFRA
ncbi:hypothetical protein BC937DRAFT_94976 [Endogone sp. FLAS-F59071]|nr:hypothetical protein BC937DRAFT_94976 [Endogone sp. FLAS-F59071]|eukprot:RUS13655.1 hypothetical protein BC937DRAFT_94976 [Endogone sp. FLAS-F59071]